MKINEKKSTFIMEYFILKLLSVKCLEEILLRIEFSGVMGPKKLIHFLHNYSRVQNRGPILHSNLIQFFIKKLYS